MCPPLPTPAQPGSPPHHFAAAARLPPPPPSSNRAGRAAQPRARAGGAAGRGRDGKLLQAWVGTPTTARPRTRSGAWRGPAGEAGRRHAARPNIGPHGPILAAPRCMRGSADRRRAAPPPRTAAILRSVLRYRIAAPPRWTAVPRRSRRAK